MTTTKTTATSSVEVTPKATRRNFPTEYKLSLIEQADRCKTKGASIGPGSPEKL